MSAPSNSIFPDVGLLIPKSTSTNSLCPFPETPATPSISPLEREKLMSSKIVVPSLSLKVIFSTFRSSEFAAPSICVEVLRNLKPPKIMDFSKSILSPTINFITVAWSTSGRLNLPNRTPLLKTAISSATAITSCSLCVMKTTPSPSLIKFLKALKSVSTSCGVKLVVGSSRISILIPLTKALSISTLCLTPNGRFLTFSLRFT